jgi:3-phenylpropionate/trans-cinnamate dioxygenase ferredoxin reductase subunit
LAVAAGLKVDDGIVVDEQLQSSAPGVYAAGDVASAWHPHYGRHLRVEHWANALNQGLTAGVNAAGGAESYTRLPYFFSDQYDLGLEYVGFSDPGDALVVRGSLADRTFIAFWHRHGIVTAAMNVNVWDVVEDPEGDRGHRTPARTGSSRRSRRRPRRTRLTSPRRACRKEF